MFYAALSIFFIVFYPMTLAMNYKLKQRPANTLHLYEHILMRHCYVVDLTFVVSVMYAMLDFNAPLDLHMAAITSVGITLLMRWLVFWPLTKKFKLNL